jgi:hypothetical protein
MSISYFTVDYRDGWLFAEGVIQGLSHRRFKRDYSYTTFVIRQLPFEILNLLILFTFLHWTKICDYAMYGCIFSGLYLWSVKFFELSLLSYGRSLTFPVHVQTRVQCMRSISSSVSLRLLSRFSRCLADYNWRRAWSRSLLIWSVSSRWFSVGS